MLFRSPRDLEAGKAAGFYRYLTKPLDIQIFVSAIAEALGDTPRPRRATAVG